MYKGTPVLMKKLCSNNHLLSKISTLQNINHIYSCNCLLYRPTVLLCVYLLNDNLFCRLLDHHQLLLPIFQIFALYQNTVDMITADGDGCTVHGSSPQQHTIEILKTYTDLYTVQI